MSTVHEQKEEPTIAKRQARTIIPRKVYSLHKSRTDTLTVLALLRMKAKPEHVEPICYLYAVSCSWLHTSRADAESAFRDFVSNLTENPEQYPVSRYKEVFKRMSQALAGETVFDPERLTRADPRLQFTPEVFFGKLRCTDRERSSIEAQLKHLRKVRNREGMQRKRRAAGMKTADEVKAQVEQKHEEVKRLRAEGLSVAEVARRTGYTRQRVHGILKEIGTR